MRFVLLSAACTGCLISAPEGASQSWPPVLGLEIEAISAGDLDGNGAADIVVYSSGSASQEGMYFIKDSDIDGTVRSFSKFVPASIGGLTAAYQSTGAAPAVYLATGTDKLELIQYSNILTEKARVTTSLAATGTTAWIRPLTFPGNMVRTGVSNGSGIDHINGDFTEVRPIPAPSGPSWDMAQVATSYLSGQDAFVVVATPTTITRAQIPTAMGSMFMYTSVRTGAGWLGQTTFDLNKDGREEIIGFDLAARQLCVVDPGAVLPVTPSCLAITTNFPGNEVQIFAGAITPNTPFDIVIAQGSPTETNYTLVEDITLMPGVFTAASVKPGLVNGPAHGRTVMIGPPTSLLVFGEDGTTVCVQGPC
jgi:hypothetical protein